MALQENSGVPDLTRYQAVLIDLDGTFYRENEDGANVLPGAAELVKALQRRGQPFACLTNSGASPPALKTRLAKMGADIDESHIWSCAAAAAACILARFSPLPRIYSLASEGLHELLDGKVAWTQGPTETCDAVVVSGMAHDRSTVDRQWTALQLLRRQPTALIGLCADRVFPSHRGVEFGSGAVTHMLAYASRVAPQFCGKPEPVFFQELCGRLGVAPEECILLGDNLDSDIAGAKGVGMTSALMLTGITDAAQAAEATGHRRPDYVIGSLLELL